MGGIMAGLLYKDFIKIKGMKIIWILLVCTVLFTVLRLAFPGNVDTPVPGIMVEDKTEELIQITAGELRDSLFIMLPLLLIACSLVLPSTWTSAICMDDEKNQTRQFIRALPLDKNAYIASKYIFIAVAVYVLFSIETAWIIIFNSVAGNNECSKLMAAVSQLLAVFSGFSLLLASIELPFFLTFGVKKGKLLKAAAIEALAFLAIAYLFFGNLKIFENFNIIAFADWCKEHLVIVALISVIFPIVDIVIYWLSYRAACRINQSREVEIDG